MHMLAGRISGRRLMARADWNGFAVYGDVDTPTLTEAAVEALRRLQRDEGWLAVHPRCGTNLATGILAALALGQVATLVIRSRLLRTTAIGLAMAAGLVLSGPLGRVVQARVTTSPDLRGARIAAVRREYLGGITHHRVIVGRDGAEA